LNSILKRTTIALPEREIQYYGPRILSGLLFHEQSIDIYRETGVDVYLGQSIYDLTGLPKYDLEVRSKSTLMRAIKQGAPKDGTWETVEIPSLSGRSLCRFERRVADGEVVELRAFVDQPYQHAVMTKEDDLTPQELKQKRKHQAAIARTSKADYRKDDTTDAPRFGFCKRKGCKARLERRLVIRSLCPDCRLKPEEAVSTKPTVAERRKRVLEALQARPEASQRELARLTGVSQPMVSRFLTGADCAGYGAQ
jgi:hypothetical protein